MTERVERFSGQAREAIRNAAADIKRCHETPAEEWGGHKGKPKDLGGGIRAWMG
jgi:hypothetical protein